MKVVLDSNIFISGIIFGGNPRKIIELVIEGKIQLFMSPDILREIKEVLERDKFGFSTAITRQVVHEIELVSYIVEPGISHSVVERDHDDNIIINCAFEAGAECIVTGDADLLSMGGYGNTQILNPADILELFWYG